MTLYSIHVEMELSVESINLFEEWSDDYVTEAPSELEAAGKFNLHFQETLFPDQYDELVVINGTHQYKVGDVLYVYRVGPPEETSIVDFTGMLYDRSKI